MGLKIAPVIGRRVLGHLSMFGPMAGTFGPIASPNSPNGGFNQPPTFHPSPPPAPPLLRAHPYNVPSVILQWF